MISSGGDLQGPLDVLLPAHLGEISRVEFDFEDAGEEDEGAYNQADAEGFIKLNALRLRIRSMMEKSRN